MPDFASYLERCLNREILPEADVLALLWRAMELLSEEPTVIPISSAPSLNVCGDVHGQFYDVRYMFEFGGKIVDGARYLFLGDYVDRGYYSLETITLLLCLKVNYPARIYLLRGNHECRAVTQTYGFYDEAYRKYGHAGVWKMYMELFDQLPLVAIIDERIFCVHGGISPSLPTIDDIRILNRSSEIPSEGPFADLQWSDPSTALETWEHSYRGAGYLFGPRAVDQFLRINDLKMIARAHQLAIAGYQKYFNGTVVTIWSAPNYSYRTKNSASIMVVKSAEEEFKIFEAVPADQRELPPDSYMSSLTGGWD
ncbi:Serine/threonine-protein phosphatase [Giardia duodenalis]|uniref:Serine/threonine-protein phosphatase n=1 Tax=Giardia intestinalis (strain ATCC 50803 / WB clone C6) TaxID=184922 RepID=A8B748_GIAIC|nr:Serine/threonine-protein phosphatase [Giardia intestinalis]KAE8301781.1 Serine/threonine-protein phosphatase [Giardia intestinalis]|eukprot:XP_001709140.1 Phosphatase [Giardia lamblia ATCC 50803]